MVKNKKCAFIVVILERLSVKGSLVTIYAIATNPTMAAAIIHKNGDYILTLKHIVRS